VQDMQISLLALVAIRPSILFFISIHMHCNAVNCAVECIVKWFNNNNNNKLNNISNLLTIAIWIDKIGRLIKYDI